MVLSFFDDESRDAEDLFRIRFKYILNIALSCRSSPMNCGCWVFYEE
jgi:hypothetical protein